MRLNLQRKITAGLLLPTALLLLLFAALAVIAIHQTRHEGQVSEARAETRRFAADLTALLMAPSYNAQNTAALAVRHPDLSDADYLALLQAQLRQTPSQYGAGVTFLPANYGGQRKDLYVYREGKTVREMDQSNTYDGTDGTHEWFTLAQQGGKPLWTPPYFDEGAGNVWMVSYSVPLFRNDRFDGVAVADVNIEALGTALQQNLPESDWVLLDAEGRFVYAPESRYLGRPYTDWAPASSDRAHFIASALTDDATPLQWLDWPDGSQKLTSAVRIVPLGWTVVLALPATQSADIGLHIPALLLTMLAFGVLTLWLLRRLLRRNLQPLRELMGTVVQMAAGNPAQPADIHTGDEIGVISSGISHLTMQLQKREQHLVSRQRELADRVREQQVLYRVADTLGWVDIRFLEMLDRVTTLLPEAWPRPEQIGCRINLAEFQSVSQGFAESRRGLFAPIEAEGGGGGVWVFAADDASTMEAGQQELLEGVAQQLGLAYRRERAQQQLEKLNRELEQRVELRTAALRNAERLLRDITNSMPGAVYQVVQHPPKAPELRFVSAGVEGVFGVPRDRALANYDALMNLVFPEDLSDLNAVVANAIGRRQAYSHVHRISHGESEEVRWIRSAASTVVEPDGGVLLNGYWIDVTDQKELELELEHARFEADAANEAKSRFLANMSHEIRTPMNAIIGLTHLAVQQTHEPKVRDQLNRVEDAAKALLGLLNDILDFSKIEAGRMTVERIPFDLWDVLDRVQSLISDRASEKGLMFNVWRVPHLPRDLMGDPLRLHQVLLNLVSNAVKFTERGSVTLNCTVVNEVESGTTLRFEVQDTGVGIDPIQMTRLFNAFTQADNSTTRRFGGTGLGLTICKELVTLMGGRITADSTPGAGSIFVTTLSFDHADPSWRDVSLVETDEPRADPLIGARVLVVDDNFINLEVAGELLKQAKVTVVTATNGREALEKIASSHYDAVLMDLQMPEMDGITATQQLRLDPRYANLPVIAMTANAMTGDRERCLAAGMNDHIPKPIDPVELRHTLARWLRRRSTGDLASTIQPPPL